MGNFPAFELPFLTSGQGRRLRSCLIGTQSNVAPQTIRAEPPKGRRWVSPEAAEHQGCWNVRLWAKPWAVGQAGFVPLLAGIWDFGAVVLGNSSGHYLAHGWNLKNRLKKEANWRITIMDKEKHLSHFLSLQPGCTWGLGAEVWDYLIAEVLKVWI